MQPFSISINNQQVQMGCPLPESITEFTVVLHPLLNFQLPAEQTSALKLWLNAIIDKLNTDYVMFNGVLIRSDELNKFLIKDFYEQRRTT